MQHAWAAQLHNHTAASVKHSRMCSGLWSAVPGPTRSQLVRSCMGCKTVCVHAQVWRLATDRRVSLAPAAVTVLSCPAGPYDVQQHLAGMQPSSPSWAVDVGSERSKAAHTWQQVMHVIHKHGEPSICFCVWSPQSLGAGMLFHVLQAFIAMLAARNMLCRQQSSHWQIAPCLH